MIELSNCQFYCLSYYKENRNKMNDKFKNLKIKCKFYNGVKYNDNRINNKYNNHKKRQLSIMYGHLDIIYDFYFNTNNTQYAIICEDDVIIHKNIKDIIRKVIIDFNIMKLDILLLSYIAPYKILQNNFDNVYPLKRDMPANSFYKYHDYPKYLSGTQMYMITRKYAKYILENYYLNYNKIDKPFIIDKMILHNGNKALLYPMLAIENNEQNDPYHQLCHKIHYDECYI